MKNELKTKGKAPVGKILAASLAALLLVFASCSNLFEPPQASGAGEGEGLFTLSIAGGQTAKTILPPQMSAGNFKAYTLVFTSPGKETEPIERTNDNLSSPVTLAAGTWSLVVTAFIDSEGTKPAAEGTLEGPNSILIEAGKMANKDLTLRPIIGEGDGTFEWRMSGEIPDSMVSASLSVTPIDENGTAARTYYFKGGPVEDTVPLYSSVTLNTGYYRVLLALESDTGRFTKMETTLHIYQNMTSVMEYEFTDNEGGPAYYTVTNGNYSGEGSLRHAIEIANASTADYLIIDIDSSVETILLEEVLVIDTDVVIMGNGVTIVVDPSWETGPMFHIKPGVNVDIDRVHFKDGRSLDLGGAIYNEGGDMGLFSCIFSGNRSRKGGALYNNGEISAIGCTFYGNSADNAGGAIYNNSGAVSLKGNLFYGNTSPLGPIGQSDGIVDSAGFNAVDTTEGVDSSLGDKTITGIPISEKTFRLLFDSEALDVIDTRPADYPTMDFYGEPIPETNAAAGAVQRTADGYLIWAEVNDPGAGNVSILTGANADGLYEGSVTIEATVNGDYEFSSWSVTDVNGERTETANPLNITLAGHTLVEAVYKTFSDEASLLAAINNAEDGDTIRFSGTPGTVIELSSQLIISKSVTLEGNGVTFSRGASFPTLNPNRLLAIYSGEVSIKRVHIKGDGVKNSTGIYTSGVLTLESCIFSGTNAGDGPALFITGGRSTVKGCTFYNNRSSAYAGAISHDGNSLILVGNLFYGNKADVSYPVVRNISSSETTGTYNVVDVPLGTGTNQSGWVAGIGDKTFSQLGIPGSPFDATSFVPVSGLASLVPSSLADFPATDFYGNQRMSFAPGAVDHAPDL